MNITNVNLLTRFNKAEIFPSVTGILSVLLTTSATSASVERGNFKGDPLFIILRSLVNKLCLIENTYQVINQTGSARKQKLRSRN